MPQRRMHTLKEDTMKHKIIYGLAMILVLSLFGECKEIKHSAPDTTSKKKTKNDKNSNSIPFEEIEAQKKKNSQSMQLSADPGIDEILLHWEPIKKTNAYILQWGLSKDMAEETIVLNADKTQFFHTELESATAYYYRITAELGKKKKKVSKVLEVHTGDREKIKQSDAAY